MRNNERNKPRRKTPATPTPRARAQGERVKSVATPAPGVRLAAIEELELEIERLVAGGDGLGRWEGVPIFVPRSAPGDRLRVQLVERKPDYGRAEIVEVLVPGPGRRRPPCPYFARCGGCDLQHLEDELQAQLKVGAVRETLARLGGIELPSDLPLFTGSPWGYRLRTQVHAELHEGRVRVGYHARRSNELVAIDRCPVLVPELDQLLIRLPDRLPSPPPHRLDLVAGDGGAVSAAPPLENVPAGDVELAVGPFTFAYDARTFFQAHRGLVATLMGLAVGDAKGELAVDLYCGVGLFSLPLSSHYRKVVAVEGDRIAARYARTNARRNRIRSVDVIPQAVETWISQLPDGVDRVLVDPPRAGLSRSVRRALLKRLPKRLTYVSCHAATLARDLRDLRESYRLESIACVDLFPQTGHIETVVQLVGVEGQQTRPAGAPAATSTV